MHSDPFEKGMGKFSRSPADAPTDCCKHGLFCYTFKKDCRAALTLP